MARRRSSEGGGGAPAWIVSYSDMITLLLSMFVLLQSFAKARDASLFYAGQGSFRRALSGLGLPDWLFGRAAHVRRQFTSVKHAMDEQEEPPVPMPHVLDAEDEKIRRLFDDLRKDLTSVAEDSAERPVRAEVAPIRFAAGRAELDQDGRDYLRRFALDLRQTLRARQGKVYVMGLATERLSPREQWMLSARRAEAVQEQLAALLPPEADGRCWQVDCWGTGAGGAWCRRLGIDPERSCVVLIVARERS